MSISVSYFSCTILRDTLTSKRIMRVSELSSLYDLYGMKNPLVVSAVEGSAQTPFVRFACFPGRMAAA